MDIVIIPAPTATKVCPGCNRSLEVTEENWYFNRVPLPNDTNEDTGRTEARVRLVPQGYCRDCKKARSAASYRANKALGPMTPEERREVGLTTRVPCACCGRSTLSHWAGTMGDPPVMLYFCRSCHATLTGIEADLAQAVTAYRSLRAEVIAETAAMQRAADAGRTHRPHTNNPLAPPRAVHKSHALCVAETQAMKLAVIFLSRTRAQTRPDP